MTFFLGPAIDVGPGKENTQFLKNYRITQELLSRLPAAARYYFKCHSDIQDSLGFQKSGFQTSVQFTHVINPKPAEALWESFRTKARNMIRSAQRSHECEHGQDPEAFMRFYIDNISAKGKINYRDERTCIALIAACLERDCGRIYQVRDSRGSLVSAMFCVWDESACHYLLTTRTPTSHSGATPLMVWNAVLDASRRGLVFDFDGVISEGGIRFANNFTANVQPRYIAIKDTSAYTLYSRTLARKPKIRSVFRPSPV